MVLSSLTLLAVILVLRIDCLHDPDWPEAMGQFAGELGGSATGVSMVPLASSSSERPDNRNDWFYKMNEKQFNIIYVKCLRIDLSKSKIH